MEKAKQKKQFTINVKEASHAKDVLNVVVGQNNNWKVSNSVS